jgi:hypothetical protein
MRVPRWFAIVMTLVVFGMLLAVALGSTHDSTPPTPTFTVTPDAPCVEYPNDQPCG